MVFVLVRAFDVVRVLALLFFLDFKIRTVT